MRKHHDHTDNYAKMHEETGTTGPDAMKIEGAEETPAPETPASQELADEIARLKDQVLRALAETENTRRRLTKEVEDAGKYAIGSFAKEILVVSDNFARALEAVPKDKAEDETLKNLVVGIEATERQLQTVLERFGIKKIDPTDQPFDPNFHRVMMEIEDLSKPAGTVVQVLQAGYVIHGRLLREALVAVSKGGPAKHNVDQSA
jgi:molecular chaperone GrpE